MKTDLEQEATEGTENGPSRPRPPVLARREGGVPNHNKIPVYRNIKELAVLHRPDQWGVERWQDRARDHTFEAEFPDRPDAQNVNGEKGSQPHEIGAPSSRAAAFWRGGSCVGVHGGRVAARARKCNAAPMNTDFETQRRGGAEGRGGAL